MRSGSLFNRRTHLLAQHPVTFNYQLVRAPAYSLENAFWVEAIGAVVLGLEARVQLLFETGDTNLEELVQVGGEDR